MTKILLVEDDKSLREIYGVRLLAEGYDIVSAGDGEEALAMAIKDRPDLIVSDVMMPKISGFDMLDILRSTTETRDIKVIMMTALSSEDQRLRGEQLGADRYLVKSQVGIEDVVRTVHEVLGDAPVMTSQANAFAPPAPSAVASAPAPAAPVPAPIASPEPVATPVTAPEPVAQPEPVTAPATTIPVITTAPPAATSLSTPQAPGETTLPQPTAPFSTTRPAGLGDRVIQPLERPEESGPHISDLMTQELDNHTAAAPSDPTPAMQAPEQLAPPAAPVAPPMPVTPPVMETTPLSYEETPVLPQTPPQPPQQNQQQPPAVL